MGLFSSIGDAVSGVAKTVGSAVGIGGGSKTKTSVNPSSKTDVNTTINNKVPTKPLADALKAVSDKEAQTRLLSVAVERERQEQINDFFNKGLNFLSDAFKRFGNFIIAGGSIFILIRIITNIRKN